MTYYKIENIEGIGPSYGEKLREAGVTSVTSLLDRGCDRKGRTALSEATGIDPSLLLKWVNMADLYRVWGVGSEYAELLIISGVDNVKELRKHDPKNLIAKMVEVNLVSRKLVRLLPGLKRVRAWVQQARELDVKVTY
jgi:predicted flap endonuclease-1-like 5' DNA nuclease